MADVGVFTSFMNTIVSAAPVMRQQPPVKVRPWGGNIHQATGFAGGV